MQRVCVGLVAVVVAVLATACWRATDATTQPRGGRAGLQLTGTVAGTQLAVNAGAPRLTVGDCDPADGQDDDVCAIARDISGELVVLVFENPGVLVSGAELAIADPGCGRDCDDIRGLAVVDLQIGVGDRRRARGGSLRLAEVLPFRRYAGDLRLEFDDGSVSGSFDLVPRRD